MKAKELNEILNNGAQNLLVHAQEIIQKFLTGLLNKLTSLPTIGFYIVITIISLYFIIDSTFSLSLESSAHFDGHAIYNKKFFFPVAGSYSNSLLFFQILSKIFETNSLNASNLSGRLLYASGLRLKCVSKWALT